MWIVEKTATSESYHKCKTFEKLHFYWIPANETRNVYCRMYQIGNSESSHWRTADSMFCSLLSLSLRNQSHSFPAFNSSIEHPSCSAITFNRFNDDICIYYCIKSYIYTGNSIYSLWWYIYQSSAPLICRENFRGCLVQTFQQVPLLLMSRKFAFLYCYSLLRHPHRWCISPPQSLAIFAFC